MVFMELRYLPSTVTGPLDLAPFWRAIAARRWRCSSVNSLLGMVKFPGVAMEKASRFPVGKEERLCLET